MSGALGHVNPDDLLRRYQQRAAEEIERRLPRGEPRRWLYEPLADYPRRAGKGLRAALCLAACSAHGGLEDDALAAAAAIELAHSAFLVHDDIQDGSDWRRGQPTLHRRVGVPLALNAGDALAVLSASSWKFLGECHAASASCCFSSSRRSRSCRSALVKRQSNGTAVCS